MALSENKADLANFLSGELIKQADGTVMVVAGAFEDEDAVGCNKAELDISDLHASHKETDTRIVLHAIHCANKSGAVNILLSARDTDVLILLLAHFHEIKVDTWMSAGTANDPKYIPVHEAYKALLEESYRALVPFHAITGCDTTSFSMDSLSNQLSRYLQTISVYLRLLGKMSYQRIQLVMLKYSYANSTDKMFTLQMKQEKKICNTPEMLLPTSDALKHHIKRAHYQSLVWKQSNVSVPALPSATESGWREQNQKLLPVLMTKPAIPSACTEMIQCNCKKGCRSVRCVCKQARLPCTRVCACDKGVNVACLNRQ